VSPLAVHSVHCLKIYEIPGFVLTKPFWDGNGEDYSRPCRESLVSDIPVGDGNPLNVFFLLCIVRFGKQLDKMSKG